ncbi:MAG: putative ral secretion pathway protein [Rhodospirillales bacterium]|nr:putative ral secretion pathway protein [Rhodospirillales bacterium]
MSETFFGLKRPPFPAIADPTVLFQPSGHRAALRAIDDLVARWVGIILLEAETGAGKTELLRSYQRQVAPERVLALLFNRADFDLQTLVRALGDAVFGPFKPLADAAALDTRLLERRRAGLATVLLIDNAEKLTPPAWLALAKLATLGVPKEPAVTIVLAGRPPLSSQLAAPARSAFKVRTAARINLPPWPAAEAVAFMQQALAGAGAEGPERILRRDAMTRIAAAAAGAPGRLTSIATAVLDAGAARRERPISAETVDRAVRRSAGRPAVALGGAWRKKAALAASICILCGIAWWILRQSPAEMPAAIAVAAAEPKPLPAPQPAPPPPAVPIASQAEATAMARQPAELSSVDLLLVPARRGDTLRRLYQTMYRNPGARPSFDQFLAANPTYSPDRRLPPNELIGFPGPVGSEWHDGAAR